MDYIKPFLIGGSLIAGSKYISHFVAPEYSPLIGGLPTGIIASFFILNNSSKQKYYKGYLISSIMITISIIFINIMSKKFPIMHVNKLSIMAILLWVIISFFIIRYEVKHHVI